MSSSLPSFKRPPVTEVVIGSRFQPPNGYSVISVGHLGDELVADGFTEVEERPGYQAPSEGFGPEAEEVQVSLELLSGPPPLRYWFLRPPGDELLQLQPNWIAANWRKVAPEAEYGRWESRWNAFSQWAGRAAAHLGDSNRLAFDQVEVTYINHIDRVGVWEDHSQAARVFSFLSEGGGSEGFLAAPEQPRVELRFLIPGDGGQTGRLHVSVVPAFKRPTGDPIFVMNLTARGKPATPTLGGVKAFAEVGHEWIVRGFADLTTPAMHSAWVRTDTTTEMTHDPS